MTHVFKLSVLLLILTLLPGCVADQRDRRMVKPLEKAIAPYDNGAIFKVGFNERPLFEDRRARNVGDGLIMTVAESADAIAKKKALTKTGGIEMLIVAAMLRAQTEVVRAEGWMTTAMNLSPIWIAARCWATYL
jgi:flagellar basal body L-ring protein FlgH